MNNLFSNKSLSELDKVSSFLKMDVSTEKIIKSLYKYIFTKDGKKLRPLVNLLFSRGYGAKNRLELATIIELLHVATLVHDDVVDKAFLRRGKQAVNKVWSNSHSVLIGDYIYSKAFIKMVALKRLDILKELSNATNDIAKGELLQLTLFNSRDVVTKQQCLKVAYYKTGRLFEASALTGAMLRSSHKNFLALSSKFGKDLGIAFQIKDDLLDFKIQSKSGKEQFKDFVEGKYTLPLVLALQKTSLIEKKFLNSKFGKKLSKADKEKIYDIMDSSKGISSCENILNGYVASAQEVVSKLEKSMDCNDLNQLISYSSLRTI
jgi:octaprenyl-diphosphate synthase